MPVAIKFGPFGPMVPRTAERVLSEGGAQVASNVNLLSGEIRPVKIPLTVDLTVAGSLAVHRAEYAGGEKWRGWTMDVDVAVMPLPTDVEYRYIWTGDGPPKWSTFTNFDTVASDLTLGIPNPITLPTVTPSGGVGAAVSRLYVYTFFSQNGEESGPSPANVLVTGKVDDTWAITLMDAIPVNGDTIQAMPSTFFVTPVNTFANATGAAVAITSSTNAAPSVITKVGHGFLDGDHVYIVGHTVNTALNSTPTNPTWIVVWIDADNFSLTSEAGVAVDGVGVGGATGNVFKCTPHWLRATDQLTTDLGATQYTVATIASAYSFTISSTTDLHTSVSWARVANWNTSGMTKRLYRSTGTTATYQLVAENITTTTYNDTILDVSIPGDELISDGWLPPPVGLFAVSTLPNGATVGISGTLLCFSEPYQAHAWPLAYQFGMGFQGVGLATYGTTTVVGTLGKPFVADGVEPASTTLQSIDDVWPCLSKRSMVPVGDGVAFSTLHGMAYIGVSGSKIWSEAYYTREEWNALTPSSMVAAISESRIFVRYLVSGESSAKILVFYPTEPIAQLTTLDIDCVELYSDKRNGQLYIVDDTAAKQYDAGTGNRLVYEWKSREYELPTPVNMGAGRVEFVSEMTQADIDAAQATYDAAVAAQGALIADGAGALNGGKKALNMHSAINGYTPPLPAVLDTAYVDFTLYSKGAIVFSAHLLSNEPFPMLAGYKSDAYSIRLDGTVRVKNVKIAETMRGLSTI